MNDYVTLSASVSDELLPTSVTFHEVTQSINLLTAQVLLFRHEIPGTNRRQDTHSLSVGPVTVTVDSVVGAPLPASGSVLRRVTFFYLSKSKSNSPAPQLSTAVVVVVSLVCGKINGCGTILTCLCDFSV